MLIFGNIRGFCHWGKQQSESTSFTDSLFGIEFLWVNSKAMNLNQYYLLSVTAASPAISKMAEPSVERVAEGLLGLWGTDEPSWASMPVPVILHSWERFPGSCGQTRKSSHVQPQLRVREKFSSTLKDISTSHKGLNSSFHSFNP